MEFKWYILFVRKNYEPKVLKDFKTSTSLDEFSWLKEKVSEIRFLEGKDKSGMKKNLVPGYMFINCQIDRGVIDFIYSIKEVVGFLNYGKKNLDQMPSPLSNIEVNNFFFLLEQEESNSKKSAIQKKNTNKKSFTKTPEEKIEKQKKNVSFTIGDIVVIKEGVFRDNQGSVVQVNRNLLTVNIEFLGRFTPVSIDSLHCEKI